MQPPDPSALKQLVNDALTSYVDERITDAAPLGESYVTLWRTIKKLILSGGKRLRPRLLIHAYLAYTPKGDIKAVMPAAIAQELLHVAMLIHDDIIDRDLIRYGIKNIAGQYHDIYEEHVDDLLERSHLSLGAALLAGDVLLADAYRLMRGAKEAQKQLEQAQAIFSQGIFEVIGGELLDSEAAILPKGSISAEVVARYKTASYSFINPLTIGAVLANAPAPDVEVVQKLAEEIGIGYQLQDDLLGMFGDEKVIGKSVITDLREGKRTFLVEQFEKCASPSQQATFSQIFHKVSAGETEFLEAKRLIEKSGAKAAVEATIDNHFAEAKVFIDQLHTSSDGRSSLSNFIDVYLVSRSS